MHPVTLALLAALTHSAPTSARSPSAMLAKLVEDDWQYELSASPTWASILGDRRFDDRWDDLSPEGIEARHRHDVETVAALDALLGGKLSAEDRLNAGLLRKDHAWRAEAHDLGWQFLTTNHMGGLPEGLRELPGVQTAWELGGQLPFASAAEYEAWVRRLERFGTYVDQVVALMREGIRKKLVHPRILVQRIPPQIDRLLVAAPEGSGFYAPFRAFPASVAEADRARLSAAGAAAIRSSVLPALARFRDFVAGEYLAAAPEQVGAWQWPRGAEIYAYWARRSTTTDRTPDELHALGLSEVARIRGEMEKAKEATGFLGSLADFFELLRKDPRFYHPTPEALLLHYRDLAKRIDPTLPRLFRTLPRAPYGVEPTPSEMAPDVTTGFYVPGSGDGLRPGTYLVNLHRPETRPRWEMVPLTLHEAVPGHHLQVSLAAEQTGLPAFRRFGYHTAYGEGWALYAETLGGELGLLDDPYDRFGQLAYEMWRAVRLVVDTGLHVRRWTRARALAYFLENSPRQELDATNEIDRYIAVPGQALAYKVGEMEIRAMRRRAEQALGERFDVRAFHDVVLLGGSLPLDALRARVEAWVEAERSRAR